MFRQRLRLTASLLSCAGRRWPQALCSRPTPRIRRQGPWRTLRTPRRFGQSAAVDRRACASAAGVGDDANAVVPEITAGQKREVFVASAVPFVAFGFMDNFIMIIAGDVIDNSLCVTFCFSTMAAAAIGNTISDVVGIYSSGIIEQLADRFGIREPPLKPEQRRLRSTKFFQYFGQMVGIVTGCILGMCPLLVIDMNEASRLKRSLELKHSLDEAMPEIQRVMKAQGIVLVSLDEDTQELHGVSQSLCVPELKPWKITDSEGHTFGALGHVASTGRFMNLADITRTNFYVPELHDNWQGSGMKIQSVLCMPLLRGDKVEGLLAAFNKEDGGSFTDRDEDSLSFIASHIAARMESIQDVQQSVREVVLTCERILSKQESLEYSRTAAQRTAELYLPALEGIRHVLRAEAVALLLVNRDKHDLYSEAIAGSIPKHGGKIGEGMAGQCAEQGRVLNVVRGDGCLEQWFDEERHLNYLGTGMEIRSELCVPLFMASKKCLGVIKVLNKEGGKAFTSEDVEFASEVARKLEIMLEDGGALKQVLALTRSQSQRCQTTAGCTVDRYTVICTLERGENLPESAGRCGRLMDPYVTVTIVHGDPLKKADMDMEKATLHERTLDRMEIVRKFARTQAVRQDLNPLWRETLAASTPVALRCIPHEELFLHVMLWDWNATQPDELIAQAAICLAEMPQSRTTRIKKTQPVQLLPVPTREGCDLEQSKLWLAVSRGANPAEG